jgi:hypothetical protein
VEISIPLIERADGTMFIDTAAASGWFPLKWSKWPSGRTYGHAIQDSITSYYSEPRLAFGRTIALRYRYELEGRRLSPATINLTLGGS